MSITRRIVFGATASWVTRSINIVLGLMLMPILFRKLPAEEVGLWLLFAQTLAGAAVLELGFTATLTRRIALAKGRSGSDPGAQLTQQTLKEIASLVQVGQRVYAGLALTGFTIAWLGGLLYLRRLQLANVPVEIALLAWTILCVGQALILRSSLWINLLQGLGFVGWESILTTLVGTVTLLTQVLLVTAGGGLIALAGASAAGAVAQRTVLLTFVRKRRPDLFRLVGKWDGTVFKGMVRPSALAWCTTVGTALVFYSDQFFVSQLYGVEAIPPYRATFVLIHNITVVAVTFAVASSVFISHLWQNAQLPEVHRLVMRHARMALLIMLTSGLALVTLGSSTFDIWLGHGNFVGYPVLVVFLVTETLEAQSYVIATSSRATEDEAFAWSSVAAGLLKLGIALYLTQEWGLVGLALSTAIALGLTNHWYMVFRGLGRLGISGRTYFAEVLMPCARFGLIAAVVLWSAGAALTHASDGVRVVVVVTLTGTLLTIAGWFLVLESGQRLRIRVDLTRRLRGIRGGR